MPDHGINCAETINIMIPVMETKLRIFSEDDMRQSSVKTEHNVGWQTYLSSRRDIIVAEVQSRGMSLAAFYSAVRSDYGLEFRTAEQEVKFSNRYCSLPEV